MAYLASQKRESLIKKINKSYAFRKILIVTEVLALIAFIAVTIVSFYQWIKVSFGYEGTMTANELLEKQCLSSMSWFRCSTYDIGAQEVKITLSNFGIGMVVWGGLMVIMGIISTILTFTAKSPSKVTEQVVQLASTPVAGRKLKAHPDIGQVVKERLTSRVELERQAAEAKAEAREKARKAREKAKKR